MKVTLLQAERIVKHMKDHKIRSLEITTADFSGDINWKDSLGHEHKLSSKGILKRRGWEKLNG